MFFWIASRLFILLKWIVNPKGIGEVYLNLIIMYFESFFFPSLIIASPPEPSPCFSFLRSLASFSRFLYFNLPLFFSHWSSSLHSPFLLSLPLVLCVSLSTSLSRTLSFFLFLFPLPPFLIDFSLFSILTPPSYKIPTDYKTSRHTASSTNKL